MCWLKQLDVLICDDSMLIRKKLKDLLEKLGCRVWEAQNGEAGLEVYQQVNPQAVFMDIVMPKVGGLDALKKIKIYDPSAKVIMLSSTGTATKLAEAIKNGAVDFIQKPYEDEQIRHALKKISVKG
ncbi:MAG: response regulator receiver protein [Firmicutes bacterium]|nr:response regulator receiver protein [Bacillota bacterium]